MAKAKKTKESKVKEPHRAVPSLIIVETGETSRADCNACGHHVDKHYGGNDAWCNHNGCLCTAYSGERRA